MKKRFALIGAAGYVAPRHMKAIKDVGGELVAAIDPFDSVGILDSYFPNCEFFTEIERFDRHLEKLRRNGKSVDYVSICSPNYLHDAHCRLAMRTGANVICEKPVVLNPWNIDQLQQIEKETGKNVHCVLQLRHHPNMIKFKEKIFNDVSYKRVILDTVTPRGKWYDTSWKGNISRSGGLATNIGVHLFDLMSWVFGKHSHIRLITNFKNHISGVIIFDNNGHNAEINFRLSTRKDDLPDKTLTAYRKITVNDEELRFDDVFTDLHTLVYQEILNGNGYGLEHTKEAIQIVSKIRKRKF